ncbi:MAG: GntR family transcriptional regulator [Armatimonadetes bacterium]|nr:GntR family transcriptional regulator [Armatimonadota bacterium]
MQTLSTEEGRGSKRNRFAAMRPGRQTKFQEVCGRLSDLAHELGPDAKLPTVVELRDRLGVSVATLNSVLTELESQRVVRRRHGVGIYVAPNIAQHRVCLICDPSFFRNAGTSPFWNLLVEQVRRRAEAEREAFSFHFATDVTDLYHGNFRADDLSAADPYLPRDIVDDIRAGRIDAVIGVGLPLVTADWIERQGMPFVAFAGPGQYTVGLDTAQIVRVGVTQLCELGCQRIGFYGAVAPYRFLVPEADSEIMHIFADTLAAHGRTFDKELVWDNQHLLPEGGGTHTLSHQEQGYHAAMEAFGSHTDRADWADGIFSLDDMVTQGLMTALQRLGITVGKDVQIATHSNAGSPALLGGEDRITRLELNPAEIVGGMFDTIESLLRGEIPVHSNILVKPRLRLAGDL